MQIKWGMRCSLSYGVFVTNTKMFNLEGKRIVTSSDFFGNNSKIHSISAAPDGASCFSDDEVAWPDIADDWIKYCTQTLPCTYVCQSPVMRPQTLLLVNHPVERRKPAPSMSATTVPFPDFTEDTSISDLQNMVKTFLEKQWGTLSSKQHHI